MGVTWGHVTWACDGDARPHIEKESVSPAVAAILAAETGRNHTFLSNSVLEFFCFMRWKSTTYNMPWAYREGSAISW